MQPEEIKQLIETKLDQSQAFVDGDGAHFTALVISPLFANHSRIERQKMVYNTVEQQLLDGTLHALSVKTFTPAEWDNQPTNQDKK